MDNPQIENDGTPLEIDFSKAVRGLHHIPPGPSLKWIAENAVDDPAIPDDLAQQHDHYLYGSPKKED